MGKLYQQKKDALKHEQDLKQKLIEDQIVR